MTALSVHRAHLGRAFQDQTRKTNIWLNAKIPDLKGTVMPFIPEVISPRQYRNRKDKISKQRNQAKSKETSGNLKWSPKQDEQFRAGSSLSCNVGFAIAHLPGRWNIHHESSKTWSQKFAFQANKSTFTFLQFCFGAFWVVVVNCWAVWVSLAIMCSSEPSGPPGFVGEPHPTPHRAF